MYQTFRCELKQISILTKVNFIIINLLFSRLIITEDNFPMLTGIKMLIYKKPNLYQHKRKYHSKKFNSKSSAFFSKAYGNI